MIIFQNVLEWCLNNTDILALILTSLTTCLTGFWLFWTIKSVRETYRPQIFIYLKAEGNNLYLIKENIGTRPAFNISFNFTPDLILPIKEGLPDKNNDEQEKHIVRLIQSFAPKTSVKEWVGTSFMLKNQIDKNIQTGIYEVCITYYDKATKGKSFYDKYTIDFMNYVSFAIDHSELHLISENIKKLDTSLNKITQEIKKINK